MSMSVMLHNQGQDPCHTCSECKQKVEVYWHCTECHCKLCINCYNTKGHTHKMVKMGPGLVEEAKGGNEGGNQGELLPRRPREPLSQSIQRCIQALVHASQCHNANCSQASCQKMKQVVQHTKSCQRKSNGGCPMCKQLVALCCHHAKQCRENPCPVPLCFHIKQNLRQQRLRLLQQRLRLRQQLNKNELPQG